MTKTFAHLYVVDDNQLNVVLSLERVPNIGEYIHVWLSEEEQAHFTDTGSGTMVFRVAHVDMIASSDGREVQYPSEIYAVHVPRELYLERRRKSLETTK